MSLANCVVRYDTFCRCKIKPTWHTPHCDLAIIYIYERICIYIYIYVDWVRGNGTACIFPVTDKLKCKHVCAFTEPEPGARGVGG
jgi:hypothetical protein